MLMAVQDEGAEEDNDGYHDGFSEDTGIGNVTTFSKEKRAYSRVKDLFNDILVDVGENPSLLEEFYDRLKEHVATPIFEKIARINAADNAVGGISSLSSVNKGLPRQVKRIPAGWENRLDASRPRRKRRGATSDCDSDAEEEEHELESERKKK